MGIVIDIVIVTVTWQEGGDRIPVNDGKRKMLKPPSEVVVRPKHCACVRAWVGGCACVRGYVSACHCRIEKEPRSLPSGRRSDV